MPPAQHSPIRPLTSDDFQAMIPAHFLSGGSQHQVHVAKQHEVGFGPSVTVTVNKAVPDLPMLPPAPTELGLITETITKSTFTETVMTRVTDNHLVEPLISEVIIEKFQNTNKMNKKNNIILLFFVFKKFGLFQIFGEYTTNAIK